MTNKHNPEKTLEPGQVPTAEELEPGLVLVPVAPYARPEKWVQNCTVMILRHGELYRVRTFKTEDEAQRYKKYESTSSDLPGLPGIDALEWRLI